MYSAFRMSGYTPSQVSVVEVVCLFVCVSEDNKVLWLLQPSKSGVKWD